MFFENELISLLFNEQCSLLSQIYGKPGDTENGWKDFLENVGFNPQSNSYIREPGIFINNSIFENVTGVIVRMQNNESFGAYPCYAREQFNPLRIVRNPFAEEQINCLDLEEIIPWRTVEDICKTYTKVVKKNAPYQKSD